MSARSVVTCGWSPDGPGTHSVKIEAHSVPSGRAHDLRDRLEAVVREWAGEYGVAKELQYNGDDPNNLKLTGESYIGSKELFERLEAESLKEAS